MKKYKNITVILILVGITMSCTNLDEQLYSQIPLDRFGQTEQEVLMSAGNAYTRLQHFPEEQMLWSLMENSSDELVIPGRADGQWVDQGRWAEIHTHKISPGNKINGEGWDMVFQGIAECSKAIYETELSTVQFADKPKIVAEIHILRAFFYYWAIDNWANIPFQQNYTDTELPPQKNRAFIVDYILKEINANIKYLDTQPTSENYGRVTAAMAHMLKAKIYLNSNVWLNTQKWTEANAECDSIIGLNAYHLEDNYFNNFVIRNDSSRENIFVIPYNSILTVDRFYWSTLSLNADSKATFDLLSEPWDGFVCDPTFFTKYKDNDLRRKSFLFGQQYDINGAPIIVGGVNFIYSPTIASYDNRLPHEGARISKYQYQTGLIYDQNDMENDFVLFRYADVVYTKLEALRHLGRTSEYISDANVQKIRTRAGLTPYTEGDLTDGEFLDELGREFAWEGHRRQDQVRFGTYGNPGWNTPGGSNDYIFPIPLTVLNANPTLVQNP